jgi:hypothetical protein
LRSITRTNDICWMYLSLLPVLSSSLAWSNPRSPAVNDRKIISNSYCSCTLTKRKEWQLDLPYFRSYSLKKTVLFWNPEPFRLKHEFEKKEICRFPKEYKLKNESPILNIRSPYFTLKPCKQTVCICELSFSIWSARSPMRKYAVIIIMIHSPYVR